MPITEKQNPAGAYLLLRYYKTKKPPRTRNRKRAPTKASQEWLNGKNAEIKMELLINENFSRDDYALHATYTDAYMPETLEEVERDKRNFIRRLKRAYEAVGKEFKWLCVIERGNSGRWHLHMLISRGLPRDVLESKWGFGYCNTDRLQWTERGLKGLQRYIVKERVTYKRWSASRNLQKPPKPKERGVRKKAFDMLWDGADDRQTWEQRFPGYYFVEAQRAENPEFCERYITVRMCRHDAPLAYVEDCFYSGAPPQWRKKAKRHKEQKGTDHG